VAPAAGGDPLTRAEGGGEGWTEHTVAADEAGRTVQEILTGPLGVSRRMLQRLTRSRGIRQNGGRTHLSRTVRAGDVVAARLTPPEAPGLAPVSMALAVAHEDDEVLVVDKPPGLLVHPASPQSGATLSHGVAAHFRDHGVEAKVRPVHRIDRDTSGLVLFAKSAHAHQRLDRAFREGAVSRRYLAFVDGAVEGDEGVWDAPIGRNPRHPHLRAVRGDGAPARTRWRVAERYPTATLLELELETGRTHQVRVHAAHAGHPVLGDRQYGGGSRRVGRQALHACELAFAHPAGGERITARAALPPDLEALRERLRPGGGSRPAE
jgi:23S rRNA pseudouridine1911/1915/1917 synthase